MKKRFFTGFIAIAFFFTGGTAHAFIPLIPGVVPLATYLGASGALATAIDFSLVLHGAVLAIALNKTSGAATTPTSSQLTVKLNPKDPLAIPSGWVAPVPPAVAATPPATAAGTNGYTNPFQSTVYSTAQNACQAGVVNAYGAAYPGSYGVATNLNCSVRYSSGGEISTFNMTSSTTSCGAGYTFISGHCQLSNPAVINEPADGNCQIMRVGNTFSVNSKDPDCATTNPTMSGAAVGTGTISMMRADGSVATVSINSDGTTTVAESYPDVSSAKTNTLTTNYSAPNPSTGEVDLTGISTGSTAGIGDGNQGPAKTGDSQLVVDKLTSQDVAAAAAAAANSALPSNPATVEGLHLPITNPFSSILPSSISNSLMPSNGGGGCIPLTVTLPHMGVMSFEPCAVVDAVRPMVNFLIIALGVISGIGVWLRPGGA